MVRRIHAAAGVLSLLIIASFMVATIIAEVSGDLDRIKVTKQLIVYGLFALVPLLMAAGGSGFRLAAGRRDPLTANKRRRMPFIALNGIVVLIPSALFLNAKAQVGALDTAFVAVQGVELLAGFINLTLLGLNMRDGLRMTGRIGGRASKPESGAAVAILPDGPILGTGLPAAELPSGEVLQLPKRVSLCRCGASGQKPFCDGSHATIGFSGARSPNRTPDDIEAYDGAQATIAYNRLLCSKSEICSNTLSAVFRSGAEPWIVPDAATIAEIEKVIRACPSGALRLARDGGAPEHRAPTAPHLRIVEGGPYEFNGVRLSGAPACQGQSTTKYALCRCGRSTNKPYCDGSHTQAG